MRLKESLGGIGGCDGIDAVGAVPLVGTWCLVDGHLVVESNLCEGVTVGGVLLVVLIMPPNCLEFPGWYRWWFDPGGIDKAT